MTDRTAAEVMCCPDGCLSPLKKNNGICAWATADRSAATFVKNLHAAGYMIVPMEPTSAMLHAGYAARTASRPEFGVYRAMTTEGELK